MRALIGSKSAASVKRGQLPKPPPDVMIGLMGPTGTGKSSFIRLITRKKDVQIGHSVQSMTSEIGRYNYFTEGGRCVTFVDTPGFDDSREGITDTDVLRKIASFLDVEFKNGKKLSGLIYLHRITDPRMGGSSNRNLKMFQKLCGEDALKNVIIVTTRWDDVQEKDREAMGRREEELMMTKGKFFEPIIAAGGQFVRHDNTVESTRRIMEKILDNNPIGLQIQIEMRDGKKVEETAAGIELMAEMNRLIEKNADEMKNLREEMEEAIAGKDEELKSELEAERTRLQREMEKWEAEKKRLAGDFGSIKQAAVVAQKEAERQMGQQRDEFLRNVREAAKKVEKERTELQGGKYQIEKEKADANRRLNGLVNTKNTADQNNRILMAQIQAQIDQARWDKEEADRKYKQLLQSTRALICHWVPSSGTFRSASFSEPPIECGVKNNLSCFITRFKDVKSSSWIFEGAHYPSHSEYEVLVGNMKGLLWVSYHGPFKVGSLSRTPIPVGTDSFVARLRHRGDIYPTSVSEGREPSRSVNGTVVRVENYDVLCYRDL